MSSLTFGSLCAGYGGLDMGVASVLGGQLKWFSEFDAAPSKVMAHHHPGVPNLGDLTVIDWAALEPVDVLTAGFPCQPFSHAGKRLGANDERHLWPYIQEGIAILRPQLVVLENVRGLLSGQGEPDTDEITELESEIAWFDEQIEGMEDVWTAEAVRIMGLRKRKVAALRRARRGLVRAIGAVTGGLADIGYDSRWYGLRAADVGAAHGRWRVFIFAVPADTDLEGLEGLAGQARAAQAGRHGHAESGTVGPDLSSAPVRDPKTGRFVKREPDSPVVDLLPTPRATRGGSATETVNLLPTPTASDHNASGGNSPSDVTLTDAVVRTDLGRKENPRHLLPTPRAKAREGAWAREDYRHNLEETLGYVVEGRTSEITRPPEEIEHRRATRGGKGLNLDEVTDWGDYAPAVERWELAIARPVPAPTEPGTTGPRLSARFVEWLMGLPEGHVTSPDVGLRRSHALKCLGNGVVPQQAAAATRAFLHDTVGAPEPKGESAPATLLPTPNAFHMGNTEQPDDWRKRRADVFKRTGTRHGPALSVVALSIDAGEPLVPDNYMPDEEED